MPFEFYLTKALLSAPVFCGSPALVCLVRFSCFQTVRALVRILGNQHFNGNLSAHPDFLQPALEGDVSRLHWKLLERDISTVSVRDVPERMYGGMFGLRRPKGARDAVRSAVGRRSSGPWLVEKLPLIPALLDAFECAALASPTFLRHIACIALAHGA
ncbi:hypothetical protein MPH_10199 [Macrophomina phaseolina MS6]|uniref:Uncharacterized protein n=1 Tax=Macrophomina phaseolina (strain MS6) TaxID=1126212 RepID=K2S707_MACPH|nr:hypothetical protein MPH_10199 [Macrophomina phaseolina MS6]